MTVTMNLRRLDMGLYRRPVRLLEPLQPLCGQFFTNRPASLSRSARTANRVRADLGNTPSDSVQNCPHDGQVLNMFNSHGELAFLNTFKN
jgi:hypothetical protein